MSVCGIGVSPAQADERSGAYSSIPSVNSVLKDTRSYVLNLFANYPEGTDVYGTSSEWMLLSLARDKPSVEESVYSDYYDQAVKFIQDNDGKVTSGGGREKPTDYERIILALTAMGYDASNIGGHNLFTFLSTQSNVTWQGVNSDIFGLLAVESNADYDFLPASATGAEASDVTTKQTLIDSLLSRELDGGGWNLFGSKADVDLTAMALQALSPFKATSYDKDGAISAAIERGLAKLSSIQSTDGGFSSALSGASYNSNSQAQVVTALAALGIPDTDERFVKNGNTAMSNLLTYAMEGGGFKYLKTQRAANGMATEQCYYSLVAYARAARGENRLYDMSDTALGDIGRKKAEEAANSSHSPGGEASGKTEGSGETSGSGEAGGPGETGQTGATTGETGQASASTGAASGATTGSTAGNASHTTSGTTPDHTQTTATDSGAGKQNTAGAATVDTAKNPASSGTTSQPAQAGTHPGARTETQSQARNGSASSGTRNQGTTSLPGSTLVGTVVSGPTYRVVQRAAENAATSTPAPAASDSAKTADSSAKKGADDWSFSADEYESAAKKKASANAASGSQAAGPQQGLVNVPMMIGVAVLVALVAAGIATGVVLYRRESAAAKNGANHVA
jgi:hypothetical protein